MGNSEAILEGARGNNDFESRVRKALDSSCTNYGRGVCSSTDIRMRVNCESALENDLKRKLHIATVDRGVGETSRRTAPARRDIAC